MSVEPWFSRKQQTLFRKERLLVRLHGLLTRLHRQRVRKHLAKSHDASLNVTLKIGGGGPARNLSS
jgi:hypothetical protein